jgi:hypothetical protein
MNKIKKKRKKLEKLKIKAAILNHIQPNFGFQSNLLTFNFRPGF